MNEVDRLLGDTADFLEGRVMANEQLRNELGLLVKAGQKPHVIRLLDYSLPGASVSVVISKDDYDATA